MVFCFVGGKWLFGRASGNAPACVPAWIICCASPCAIHSLSCQSCAVPVSFAGRYNGETRFGAAEYGPFDGLHLAGERTGRIGDIVDVAACHAYVLEVVDVPADVHIHLVLAQDGIETCLHIRTFALVLRGFGIDGMVSGNDNPVLFGGSQYGIYPGKLLLVILLAGIGIGLAFVAVFVNHRGGVYPKDADGSAVVLERLGIITGGHGPAAADITVVEHSLRIAAVFVVAQQGNQSIISSGWL